MMKMKCLNYNYIVVILLSFVALLNYADRQMISTMKDYISIDISELNNVSKFGNIMTIFLLSYGIFSPISGFIADILNRKYIIIISLLLWSFSIFFTGYATTYNEICIFRILMGISEAFYIPAALSLISNYHPKYSLSLAISIHTIGIYIGQIVGSYGAYLSDIYSWRNVFIYFGLIGIIYGLILLFILKDNFRKTNNIKYKFNYDEFIKNKYFYIVLLIFLILSVCNWAIRNWIPTIFSNKLNISQIYSGPLSIISITICSFIGAIIGGILSDFFYKKYNNGRLYITYIGLLLIIPTLIFIGYSNNLYILILSCCLFGFGFSFYDINNMPIINKYISTNQNALIYGIMNMFGLFGGALGTSIFAKLIDMNNINIGFTILSFLILIFLIIFIKLKK